MTERTEAIARNEHFTQVCIWPALLVDNPEEFTQQMLEHLGVRIQFLETINTAPDIERGLPVPDTGGRADVFFAVHQEDIGKFAIARLQFGIRWLEDAISEVNGGNRLYPEYVAQYKTW